MDLSLLPGRRRPRWSCRLCRAREQLGDDLAGGASNVLGLCLLPHAHHARRAPEHFVDEPGTRACAGRRVARTLTSIGALRSSKALAKPHGYLLPDQLVAISLE